MTDLSIDGARPDGERGVRGADGSRGRGVVVLALVWLLGTVPAIARSGLQSARDVGVVVGLSAVALAVIVVVRPAGGRRPGAPDVAAGVVAGAVGIAAIRFGFVLPAAVVVITTALVHGALVGWPASSVAQPRRQPVAGLALAPLVVASLSWYRSGSPARFLALSAAAALILEVYRRRPHLFAGVDRAVGAVAAGVSRAVTTVVATALMVLVVLPVSAVSRLFGYSPLDSGWVDGSSAWIAVDPRRLRTPAGRPARPTSMAMLELAPAPSMRRRARWRLTVPALAVIVVALVTGREWIELPSWSKDDSAVAAVADDEGTFTRAFEDDPAFDDAPWARNVRLTLLEAWRNLEFNAAVGGWTIRDVTSEYINVRDGERSSIAPDPALGEPLTVWLLGGSAAFGAGQRDEHTIASELVRLAGEDGIAVRVRNLAVPATVNWQSAMLLVARLTWEAPPDLVVVYDGANDLALQDVLAGRGRATSDEPASLVDGELDEILRKQADAAGTPDDALPSPDEAATESDTQLAPAESAQRVLTRYGRGVQLIRELCTRAGVPVSFFWQPDLRAKRPLTVADRETLAAVNVDETGLTRWGDLSAAVRAGLGELGVTDLSGALDGASEPLYWDTVHTNEVGALLAARAIYEGLEAPIRNLR